MKTRIVSAASVIMVMFLVFAWLLCRGIGGCRADNNSHSGLAAHTIPGIAETNRFIQVLTREDAELSAAVRRDALSKLPYHLSDADFNALTGFLSAAPGRMPGVSADEQLGLKNDVLNFLLAHPNGRGKNLAAFLTAEFFNPDRDPGWRDYALQAWPAILGRDRATILSGYLRVFGSTEFRHFLGTALCGVARLLREGVDLRPLTAESMVTAVLRDPDAPSASLATALGLCREFGLTDRLRPEIAALAETSPHPLVRRIAATLTE